MPFRVFSQALNLPDPVVRASDHGWLFAETVNLNGTTLLFVYRSAWLRDTDKEYEVVADLLGRHTPELIYTWTMVDPAMVFGKGDILIYLLHATSVPTEPTDPGAQVVVEMIRAWGDPVPAELVGEEIYNRLMAKAVIRQPHEFRGTT